MNESGLARPISTETIEPPCARRLQQVVADAEPLLRAISDTESARRPAPNRWSAREIVGHLVDSASNNHQRFVRAVWQDDLVFAPYSQDEWVQVQRYQASAWPHLVTLWAAFNRHLAAVMAAVPEAVRCRVATRHNLDQVAFRAPSSAAHATLEYLMGDYVDHLEHHLRQILGARWAGVHGMRSS